jgi:hypothetical protein
MRTTVESARLRLSLIALAAATLTVGCGEGKALQSPTGPSALAPSSTTLIIEDAAAAPGTASTAGESRPLGGGNGGKDKDGNNEDADKSDRDDVSHRGPGWNNHGPGAGNTHPGRSHEDRVVGFVSDKSADALIVHGIRIVLGPNAVIRHGARTLALSDIEVGDHVQALGTREGNTLVATEIKVEDTGQDDDEDEDEVVGTVSGLSTTSTCPVITFMIGTSKVTTSASTVFDDVTCGTLANNMTVEVEGIRQADGSILATRVEAEAGRNKVKGLVFEFSGAATCPAASFRVGPTLSLARRVTTSASTTFSGMTCAALANGVRVEVVGTTQPDGSMTAASVEVK